MSVSVALCTYDGALYLQAQLDSLARQERLPDELVVCDDRSNDETTDVLEAFAAAAPFQVRLYINKARLGTVQNFAKAIALCSGSLIALCDQDDVWHPRKLALSEASIVTCPEVGLAFSDAELVDAELSPIGVRAWEAAGFGPDLQRRFDQGKAFEILSRRFIVTGTTMMFRSRYREVILPIPLDATLAGGHPLYHDAWIALAISTVAQLAVIREPLVRYRVHPDQQLGFSGKARGGGRNRSQAGGAIGGRGTRASRSTELALESHQARLLSARLQRSADRSHRLQGESLRLKAGHLQARAHLPAARRRRVPPVLRELFTLRYHRCSKGLRTALRDCLVR